MTYPTHPNFTIQKIAREVSSKIDRGEDAYTALLKEAQRNNLTPEVVTAAVQHINNEIYLNHYKKASKGYPKTIKAEEILNALNKTATVKVASKNNYNDLSIFSKLKSNIEKTASAVDESVSSKDYTTKRLERQTINKNLKNIKVAQSNAKYELNNSIVKIASEIAGAKAALLKNATLELTRNEVTPEEIYVLAKCAKDPDVAETLNLALTKANKTPNVKKAAELAITFKSVNANANVIKWANAIVLGKDRLCEFNEKFNSVEIASLRREGLHKLMDTAYGKLY